VAAKELRAQQHGEGGQREKISVCHSQFGQSARERSRRCTAQGSKGAGAWQKRAALRGAKGSLQAQSDCSRTHRNGHVRAQVLLRLYARQGVYRVREHAQRAVFESSRGVKVRHLCWQQRQWAARATHGRMGAGAMRLEAGDCAEQGKLLLCVVIRCRG
jgi:hypothetical protein